MERRLLSWLARNATETPGCVVRLGDDAAVLEPPVPGPLVVSTDQVIEGVHFILTPARPGSGLVPASLAEVGCKAVARSLSDLAAMGAQPWFTLAAVALPRSIDEGAARALLSSLVETGVRLGAPVTGGDISETSGPLAVTTTVAGLMEGRRPWTRSGARTGDLLVVTGSLGGSLLGRHLVVEPRLSEALALARDVDVHACIDLSDGLLVDLWRVLEASRVGAVLELCRVPVSADARRMAGFSGKPALDHALSDGEDYELLMALAAEDVDRARRAVGSGTGLSVIGRIVEGPVSLRDSEGHDLGVRGHEHLRDKPA